ncbi:melanoma-associated antigen 12-like, partial [Piliocolobus tephrosceles]|uniref:melanoma-associated antigen 12-like n=1 Tax=Piliocolobus tephrosceles TaxID=591936 RepID=UPI000E6B28B2
KYRCPDVTPLTCALGVRGQRDSRPEQGLLSVEGSRPRLGGKARFSGDRPTRKTGGPGAALKEKICLWVSIVQLLPTLLPAVLTRVSLPLEQRSQHCKPKEGLEARGEALGLVGAQAPATEEQETASSSSTGVEVTPGEVPATESPGPPQSLQGASTLPTAINYTLWSQSDEDSSNQEEEGPSAFPDLETGFQAALSRKVTELVHFLLLKYRAREQFTTAEILESVIKNCQYFFLVIFSKASEYLQLVFGIEVMEVVPIGHLYILVTCLGLSYSGLLGDNQIMPTTDLLIIILAIIAREGNSAPEEKVWEELSVLEL